MFQQTYIHQRGLPTAAYHEQLLQECLYPHARLLRGIWQYLFPEVFSPDIDLIDAVASLRRRSQFNDCLYAYHHHPLNKGPARKLLRIRLSIRRLKRVFEECIPPAPDSRPPVTKTP
ncbi:MAG: hypothetical protein ABII82_18415 [Verrucomicrobiota bacterium]